MIQTRLYSRRQTLAMFKRVVIGGQYNTILQREGIDPIVIDGRQFYPADAVDGFIKMLTL